jgi:hypothetical protein
MNPMNANTPSRKTLRPLAAMIAAAASAWLAGHAPAQTTYLTVANPNWNITLSDYGYSDFLLDNTPGFEGREYLSGEWGAAVAYEVGGNAVAPKWLERNFLFPDWATNSDFNVDSPITQTGLNADGLPIAQSVISNNDLRITLRFEMIDTVVGTPMGTKAASATGDATFLNSNRYVMKQTATIQNISGSTITGLRFFQLLHGLSSQRGVYDNRPHAGPLGEFQYDTTLSGLDPWSAGAGTSSAGLEDYIGFHAINAPGAHEIGHYGIEGNGVDDHSMGKPSDGVHLSIEDNWSSAPYSVRQGRDSFEPQQRWVAGAQRHDLGGLAPNQSASIDVLLSILTGTSVTTGSGSSGSCNGGSGVPGGLDYGFETVDSPGSCFASFSRADDAEVGIRVAQGEFDAFTFSKPGNPAQLWKVGFDGTYSGAVDLTFCYDDTLLPPGFSEDTLAIYHFTGGIWQKMNGTVDAALNKISLSTADFGSFALGLEGAVTVYSIDASVSPAASGTVTGAGTFPAGAGISLVAAPEAGFAFVNWTENGAPVSSSPTLAFNVLADRTLVANFVALGSDKAVTTVSLPLNGGSTTGGGAYPLNSSATVSATAAPGFKFSKWTENGNSVSTAKNYTFTVIGDRALVAKFKPVYIISVVREPQNGGETEVDPSYEMGELAKLKAIPNGGYSFVNWTQNGVVLSADPLFSFNVTGNRDLVANFAQGHRIDVSAVPKNAGSATGGGVHPDGETITLTADAKFGYLFTDWTETQGQDRIVVSSQPTVSFPSSANRTLEANFIALPFITPPSTVADGVATFSWPAGATGWILQESPDLSPGSWVNSTRTVTTVGAQNQVSVPTSGGGVFFRLARP